ncbi:hypothetical protein [Aliikangiella sp. IMCC44632]
MPKTIIKQLRPPKILRGLFSSVVAICLAILLISWAILSYQVEQLVNKRTSEYANSITQIAAKSAAEALLADDKILLQNLVENVAKDIYIRSATIYAEDGQIVAQYPANVFEASSPTIADVNQTNQDIDQENSSLSIPNEQAEKPNLNIKQAAQTYLDAQSDTPFIEKITYQDVTAGWFKISLNKTLLESSFRQSLSYAYYLIFVIAGGLFLGLMLLLRKHERKAQELVLLCHQLIQVNAEKFPQTRQEWFDSFKSLTNTSLLKLNQMNSPSVKPSSWSHSYRTDASVFCYLQFEMQDQANSKAAHSLSQAEKYLKAAVMSYGYQPQGNILSGCLVPFINPAQKPIESADAVAKAISLVELIQALLAKIELTISMKGYIGKGTMLVLEDERSNITGVSLSNRMMQQINQQGLNCQYGDCLFLGFHLSDLSAYGEFIPLDSTDAPQINPPIKLVSVKETINQQISRQASYIISSN